MDDADPFLRRKRPKSSNSGALAEVAAASEGSSYATYRKHRHRQTEAVRRQKINERIKELREMLGLGPREDQASVLEAACNALRSTPQDSESGSAGLPADGTPVSYQDGSEASLSSPEARRAASCPFADGADGLAASCAKLTSGSFASSAAAVAGHALGSDALDVLDTWLSSSTPDTLFSATEGRPDLLPGSSLAPSALQASSSYSDIVTFDLSAPGSTSMLLQDLGKPQALPSLQAASFECKHLPTGVCILLLTNTNIVLGGNRSAASFLGLSSPAELEGKSQNELILKHLERDRTGDVLRTHLEILQGTRTSATVLMGLTVVKTREEKWIRGTMTAVDKPDRLGIRRILAVASEVDAPLDGAARILL